LRTYPLPPPIVKLELRVAVCRACAEGRYMYICAVHNSRPRFAPFHPSCQCLPISGVAQAALQARGMRQEARLVPLTRSAPQ